MERYNLMYVKIATMMISHNKCDVYTVYMYIDIDTDDML